MHHGFWDPSKQFTDHSCLEFLWNTIECLLDNMTSECVHTQGHCVTPNGRRYAVNLILRSMLEAPLNKEISKSINHQLVCLCNNSLYNSVLLFDRANLELLLQEYGCLLIIIADNLINNIFPITINATFK